MVYQADDDVNDPFIRLNIEEMPFGEEPIDSLQILYNNFLGVKDNPLKNKFKLYPNPVSNELIISYLPSVLVKEVAIIDVQGKVVSSQKFTSIPTGNLTLDTASLKSGIYFAKVSTVEGTATLKFIKN